MSRRRYRDFRAARKQESDNRRAYGPYETHVVSGYGVLGYHDSWGTVGEAEDAAHHHLRYHAANVVEIRVCGGHLVVNRLTAADIEAAPDVVLIGSMGAYAVHPGETT